MKKIKNFILKNKKLFIISAALILILAIVLICVFCFGGSSEPEETLEDTLRKHINAQVYSYVAIRYDVSGINPRITTLRETTEGTWEAYGKVSARNTYGDSYTGTFEGTCEFIESEDDFDCSLDYSDMRKDR